MIRKLVTAKSEYVPIWISVHVSLMTILEDISLILSSYSAKSSQGLDESVNVRK